MNLLRTLYTDRSRTNGRSRNRNSKCSRLANALESLEERKVLSTVQAIPAVAHLVSGPPAEVRALPTPASAPSNHAMTLTAGLYQYTTTLRIYNNFGKDVNNVILIHTYGGITDTFRFGTVNNGQTSAPQTVRYYAGPGAGDDYWTISGTMPSTTYRGGTDLAYVTLERFDLTANNAFQDLDISFDRTDGDTWDHTGIRFSISM